MKRTWLISFLALVLACTGCQYLSGDASSFSGSSEGVVNSSENKEDDSALKNDEMEDFEEELPTEGQNFLDTKAFTFMPSEATNLFVEEFKADFFKSAYYRGEREYIEFYNYMPESIANTYHVYAFEVVSPESVMGTISNRSTYYLWYEGYITRVDDIGADPDADKGFTHFALADINEDGFFELLASYTQKRSVPAHFTYATVLDSRSKKALSISTLYRTYAYFKFNENGTLGLYETEQKGVENNGTLYTEFVANDAHYEFAEKTLFLQSKNYDVKVKVRKKLIHFPVQFRYAKPYFTVTTEMTYTGETFTYVNGDTYLAGADVSFKDGDNKIPMEAIWAGQAMTTFMVRTGEVITRTYTYYDSYTNYNEEGVYDMVISYRGEEMVVEDFLEMRRGIPGVR